MHWQTIDLLFLDIFLFFELPNLCPTNAIFVALKSERDVSSAVNETISTVPPYYTLSPYITSIYFQCYVGSLAAKNGQIQWVRFGLTVSCNKTNRIFACGSILFIKHVVVDDAGKYKCVLNGSESTFKTVAVVGTVLESTVFECTLANICSLHL
jgi:hypothetical protein